MASTDTSMGTPGHAGDHPEPTRRDFLYIATGAVGAVGAALVAWPLVDQMNPDAAALALATIEVDVSSIEPAMSLTVKWRGKPVFIRNRTRKRDRRGQGGAALRAEGPGGAQRQSRASTRRRPTKTAPRRARKTGSSMLGVCTHLGCVPLGQQGAYGGWFCPCHGSVYDTAGRIRQGPAPENLLIPNYEFTSDTTIRIG